MPLLSDHQNSVELSDRLRDAHAVTAPLVAEVIVDGDRFAVVRPRLEVDGIIALDRLPDWM